MAGKATGKMAGRVDNGLENGSPDHWLVRPQTVARLWIMFWIVLAGVVLADLFIAHHPHFGVDGSFGFGAWFGFVSCVVLVAGSKVLGAFIKRPDTYYDD